MAHAALHFSLGAAAATAVVLPRLAARARAGAPLSGEFLRLWTLSGALGLLAVAPPLLRRAGLPEAFCEGWWMNACLLHPLISRFVRGGETAAPLALGAVLGFQYALVLAAIVRRRRQRRGTAPA